MDREKDTERYNGVYAKSLRAGIWTKGDSCEFDEGRNRNFYANHKKRASTKMM